jgi:solute:Na+ symporter, SSS family
VIGLYTRWFHHWALIAGWAVAMIYGTITAYNTPAAGVPGSHFGGSTANVPIFNHTVYIALTALVINLVVAAVLTGVFRLAKIPAGVDETLPGHYLADPPGLRRARVPITRMTVGKP